MRSVQIIIPCYNYGRYLDSCVASVLSQTGVDLDVLIIDNCSTDDTLQICAALEEADRRVRVIRHTENLGHIASINEGIGQARGDYYLVLSADDLLTPGALARAVTVMEENPSVGMVYGQAIILYGDTPPPARTRMTGASVWPGREWIRLVCNAGRNFIASPEALVRTRIRERIGGYNPELPRSADMEQWLRIAAISDIGRVKGADQAYYRVHGASLSSTSHKGDLFDLTSRKDAFRSAFEREAGSIADAAEMYGAAMHAVAAIALGRAGKFCEAPDRAALVQAYRDFALSLDPDIATTRHWKALDNACRGPSHGLLSALARSLAGVRDLVNDQVIERLDYYRTRRTGIYFPKY